MGLLLAHRSQSSEATLSLTLTGRNESVNGTSQVTASMITMVPLRIRADPSATVASLMLDVLARLRAKIPSEHTGWSNIADMNVDFGSACANAFPMVVQAFQDDGATSARPSVLTADNMRAVFMGAPPLPTLSECQIFGGSFIEQLCAEFEMLVKGLVSVDGERRGAVSGLLL